MTVFTRARHWPLLWARSIQSTPFHPVSRHNPFYYLRLGLPGGFFSLFPHYNSVCTYPLPHKCHVPSPSQLKHKETIMHGHDRHNRTILSIIRNMSTTCFGQYYFWPSSGWTQLSEKTTQYIIWYSITCTWHVTYNWQYSCAMTVMSMHNFFLMF